MHAIIRVAVSRVTTRGEVTECEVGSRTIVAWPSCLGADLSAEGWTT